jgi:hypothetical protein
MAMLRSFHVTPGLTVTESSQPNKVEIEFDRASEGGSTVINMTRDEFRQLMGLSSHIQFVRTPEEIAEDERLTQEYRARILAEKEAKEAAPAAKASLSNTHEIRLAANGY